MGVVYEGVDPHIERTVAVKTINTQLSGEDKDQEKWKGRFLREARLAGNLTHRNIATIYDVGDDSGLVYIAMEYIDGQSLREVINNRGQLSHDDIYNYIQQICDAMSYAHQKGVLHCDLKAENILIDESGNIAIVDFGTARRFTRHNMTQIAALMATPSSSAPERINGDDLSPESDIFSIGVIFYEMLTGLKPFAGDDISTVIKKVLYDQPPSPTSIDDRLPREIDAVFQKALAKDPGERYHSCEEFISDIVRNKVLSVTQSAVGTIILDERTIAMPEVAKNQRSPKKIAISISILLVMMIAGSFSYYFFKYRPTNSNHAQKNSAIPTKINPKRFVVKAVSDPTRPVAKETLEPRETAGPENSGDNLRLGKQALQRHDNLSAMGHFEKARDQDPKSCEAHYLLGLAYQNHSLFDKSIAEYNEAIRLEQSYAPPYRGLAEVHEERKEMKKAIAYYENYSTLILSRKHIEEIRKKIDVLQAQLVKQENRMARVDALLRAGKEHCSQKRYDEAIRELEDCIHIDPNHEECRKVLEIAETKKDKRRQREIEACYTEGKGALKNRDYSQATQSFRKVLEMAPDHGDARRQLQLVKEMILRRQEIEKYYTQGVQLLESGDYARSATYFEKILCFDTKYKKARKYLETAKQKEKTMAQSFSSGMVSFNGGDYSQAIFHFGQVLKLNPSHKDAKRYLDIAQLRKMEAKLEEKQLDMLVDAQGDARLPEGW